MVRYFFLNLYFFFNKKFKERLEEIDHDDLKSIRRLGHLIEILHMNLDEIEHIKTTNIPLEIIPLLKRILKLNGLKSEVVFRPSTEFNYSYWNYYKFMEKSCEGLILIPEKMLSVIAFPISEFDNIMLNCILFHEIGHQLNIELGLRDKIKDLIEITGKDIDEYVKEWIARFSNIRQVRGEREFTLNMFLPLEDIVRSWLVEELYDTLNNWIDETISDLIAFHYIGIAYLISFSELSLVHAEQSSCSNTHPPLFLRLKMLFKLYNKQEYGKKLRKYGNTTKLVAKYKKIAKHSFKKERKTLNTLKYLVIENKILRILPNILELVNKSIKMPKTRFISSNIEDAVRSLLDLVPPVEIINYEKKTKKFHNPFTILNAAWIVKENYRKKTYKLFKDDTQQARIILSNLTLKALDSVEFYLRMVDQK